MKKQYKLGVIGCGFMASAILRGAVLSDFIKAKRIIVSDTSIEKLENMGQELGVTVSDSNRYVAENSEYILFAIKPQTFPEVAQELKGICPEKVISIMAGVKKAKIKNSFGVGIIKVARCMPNLPCSVGSGMMAVDMGGPVNKAAYVAATGAMATAVASGLPLTSAAYRMMAAVMAGGMVPPLALALCATCFPRLFTQQERRIAPVNYLLGLCFVTEGAVPFAAADPLRVIPACVLGGALSGALSMFWGCTLPAPHGGVLVFPLAGNPRWYMLALLLGTVAAALVLALLRHHRGTAKAHR